MIFFIELICKIQYSVFSTQIYFSSLRKTNFFYSSSLFVRLLRPLPSACQHLGYVIEIVLCNNSIPNTISSKYMLYVYTPLGIIPIIDIALSNINY